MSNAFKRDFYRMTGKKPTIKNSLYYVVFHRNVRYMLYLRILQNNKLMLLHPVVGVFRYLLSRKTGIEILPSTVIGPGFRMIHSYNITVNGGAVIGENVNMYKGSTIGISGGRRGGIPHIGNNVQIGIGAVIIGGITVGDDVLIAPNAFVNFNVPDHSIVIGNPGQIISRTYATKGYVYFTDYPEDM